MGNCSRKSTPHPSDALDRVAGQPDAADRYPVYRLANYRKGGELIDLYTTGRAKNVEKFVSEHMRMFMYNDGKGKNVSVYDLRQWKNKQNGEVCINLDDPDPVKTDHKNNKTENNINHNSNGYNLLEDHDACWRLDHRGALGESLLHVLIVCDSPVHHRIATILVRQFPRLATDIIEGDEFFGLSALHLAIAYGNDKLAQLIVQSGANVIQRATGTFFLPTDQQINATNITNYAGLAYFGEYPLAWSACFENETMYNYLLDRGGDPNMEDSFGNTVLHMVVINDKLGMYGYALRHPIKPARNEMCNSAGLTPLTLACTLGRNNIFREMLELSAVEFWRYSNITCSAFPLNALDTILPDGKTNWKSALMIILKGSSEQHLDMLEGGVVQRLLEDKWKTYARTQFLKRLAILFQHLLTLSIAVYLRPTSCASNDDGDDSDDNGSSPSLDAIDSLCDTLYTGTDVQSIIRYCAEAGSCLSSTNYIVVEQGQEIWAQGVFAYTKNLTQSPAKFIFLIANVLILLCVPCRLLQWKTLEDILLALALPGSWFFLMFFAGAVRLTGPFVTMIYSMITGDMVRFGIIYLIVLLGFSQAFYFLFKARNKEALEGDEEDEFDTYLGTWMTLLHMTLGSFQYKAFGLTYYHVMTRIVFVIFMVMVPILLLNMLIAMMGNTYTQVISKSEKEFVKQWANVVLALERAISCKKAQEYLDAYAINLKPSSAGDPLDQIKGLMVIKSKIKTKARQRKGAVMNWKKLGKKIVTLMRDLRNKGTHLKGEELLPFLARKNQGISPDDEAEITTTTPPTVGCGLGDALGQLASSKGIDFKALSTPLAGGITPTPTAPPQEPDVVPAVAPNLLPKGINDALNCISWQHDIDLKTSTNVNDTKTERITGGHVNNGYVIEDMEAVTIRSVGSLKLEDNHLGNATMIPSQLDVSREAEMSQAEEAALVKRHKKAKRNKERAEDGLEEGHGTDKPRKRKKKKKRKSNAVDNVSPESEMYAPRPSARRLMDRWSTSSVVSMASLLENKPDDDL